MNQSPIELSMSIQQYQKKKERKTKEDNSKKEKQKEEKNQDFLEGEGKS